MRLRATTIAAACALALAVAPTAQADHGPVVSDPAVDHYMKVAAEYWGGQVPQCTGPGGQPIAPHAVLADDPDPDVGAWAEVPGCRIWLDRTHWPAAMNETHCNLLVHEWGHLLGQPHSQDQNSLMWANWINKVVPGCASLRAPATVPAPAVAVTPPPKKKKLQEKVKRGKKRCVKVRHRRARRGFVAKRLKRTRGKSCVRKHSKHSKHSKRNRH